jgi:hypothetical protein
MCVEPASDQTCGDRDRVVVVGQRCLDAVVPGFVGAHRKTDQVVRSASPEEPLDVLLWILDRKTDHPVAHGSTASSPSTQTRRAQSMYACPTTAATLERIAVVSFSQVEGGGDQ